MFFSLVFFFFKQKTAYEMRISDWSSDVCSSDLSEKVRRRLLESLQAGLRAAPAADLAWIALRRMLDAVSQVVPQRRAAVAVFGYQGGDHLIVERSEERRVGKECVSTCRSRW